MEAAAVPQAPPGPQGAVCLEVSGVDQTSPASSKKGQLNAFFSASGMTVTLKDVGYVVPSNTRRKERLSLLQGVGCYFRSGEMSAIMGPSGSGKTTLLDVLAGRKTAGEVSGVVSYSGIRPTRPFLRRFVGYVEQHDTLIGELTVEEMLLYTADLKRPGEAQTEKKAAVDEVLQRLQLEGCRSVRIGSPLARGISGGQAKRTNIAIALLTTPRVLLLDEPNSGLDSCTAAEVLGGLKGLASGGITVAATVHSPTPYCFSLFDQLLLLLKGSVVYFGPNGKAPVDYFRSISTPAGQLPRLKEGENEAEWIVNLTTKADWQGGAEPFIAAYAASDLKLLADAEIERQLAQASDLSEADSRDLKVRSETATSFWYGLRTLLKYRSVNNLRTPEWLGPRIGDKLVFSCIIFTLFWQVGEDLSPANVPNIVSTLFMWTVLAAFGAMIYLPAILLERPLFVRERNDGLYSVATYLSFKMVEELGMAFVTSLAFSNLVFWTLRLQGQWVLFWLVYFVSLAIGISVAYCVAAISPTMDIANVILPTYTTSCLFFTGLLLRWSDIPHYWRWYGYIDFLRYSCGALMVNQFGGERNVPFLNGDPVLSYYSLDGVSMWAWLGLEAVFFLFFCLAAYLALSYMRHVRR